MPDLSIAGAAAGQAVSDAAAAQPFSGLTIASTAAATPYVTVALDSARDLDRRERQSRTPTVTSIAHLSST